MQSKKKLNRSHAMGVICAAILVGTEIIAASLALGWALGGLMGWGREVTLGLIGISLAGGVYLTLMFIRSALKAEPIFE
jgi:hypothetical protein